MCFKTSKWHSSIYPEKNSSVYPDPLYATNNITYFFSPIYRKILYISHLALITSYQIILTFYLIYINETKIVEIPWNTKIENKNAKRHSSTLSLTHKLKLSNFECQMCGIISAPIGDIKINYWCWRIRNFSNSSGYPIRRFTPLTPMQSDFVRLCNVLSNKRICELTIALWCNWMINILLRIFFHHFQRVCFEFWIWILKRIYFKMISKRIQVTNTHVLRSFLHVKSSWFHCHAQRLWMAINWCNFSYPNYSLIKLPQRDIETRQRCKLHTAIKRRAFLKINAVHQFWFINTTVGIYK